MARKSAAAVALGRKGGKKGGPARAAKLTSEERRESARKAALARWAKAKGLNEEIMIRRKKTTSREEAPARKADTSDQALAALLNRLKVTVDSAEIRKLSDQIERIVFHKQFTNA